ncbi:MAG: YoaK family protein [Eubacteriales bacterium]|nr:YoaK family protein [Eubacteriales bacterium]
MSKKERGFKEKEYTERKTAVLAENKQTYTVQEYLECEKTWVFALLMMSGGLLGAFTYQIRGGVFCNAQTSNIVLMGIALGSRDWQRALYLLIPISAYALGSIASEVLPVIVRKGEFLRWDTLLIGIEIIVIVFLGFLPENAPFQITQVAVNFICSMQYNTFRQAEGEPMATTFCTNHLRQTCVHFTRWIRKSSMEHRSKFLRHSLMLGMFVLGAMGGTVLCEAFQGKAIWGSAVLLIIILVDLIHADLTKEKGQLYRVPKGH